MICITGILVLAGIGLALYIGLWFLRIVLEILGIIVEIVLPGCGMLVILAAILYILLHICF